MTSSSESYRAPFPHCDSRILHAPSECEYCDRYPDRQAFRVAERIAFTGHAPGPREAPCPADVARPAGSRADHRRWGGNKPTSATGDPSWPMESLSSVIFYGDKGGRRAWPLAERMMAAATKPWRDWRKRRAGWRKEGPFWVFDGKKRRVNRHDVD